MSENTPPGWYQADDDHVMFWDGNQWIEGTKQPKAEQPQTQPIVPPAPPQPATTQYQQSSAQEPTGYGSGNTATGLASKPWYARWYSILGFVVVGLFMFMFTVASTTSEPKEAAAANPASQSVEVTDETSASASPEPPSETPPPTTPAPVETSSAPKTETTTAEPKKPAKNVQVKDGVGMSYQDAQDLWRSQGLFIMPADDATGANRLPFLDDNWYVVAQDIDPGTSVARGSDITATVLKYTDN
jgi:hypothetical protein